MDWSKGSPKQSLTWAFLDYSKSTQGCGCHSWEINFAPPGSWCQLQHAGLWWVLGWLFIAGSSVPPQGGTKLMLCPSQPEKGSPMYLCLLEPIPHHWQLAQEAALFFGSVGSFSRDSRGQRRSSGVSKPWGFVVYGKCGKLMCPVELDWWVYFLPCSFHG